MRHESCEHDALEPRPVADLHDTQSRRIAAWTRLVVIALLACFGMLFLRVVHLKTNPDPQLTAAAGSITSTRTEIARRGDLLDRRGRVIATSTLGYRLFVDPQEIDDPDTIAVALAELIGADPIAIDQAIIKNADRRYAVIDHELENWQVEAVRTASLRGVGLEPRLVRHYPNKELASGIVGLVGFEHTGLSGLEYAFNERLQPINGRLSYLRDVRRQALWIDPAGYTPGQDGQSIRLSIDLVIQDVAERHISAAVQRHQAGGGRCIVLDPATGEILAMVDQLNEFSHHGPFTTDPLRKKHPSYGRNRNVTDPYEPGSTFKPFIWAVATDLGKAKLDEVLPTPASGRMMHGRRLIRDSFPREDATWREVLIHSLNSGMSMVASRMSFAQAQDAVARFGFGTRTHCGLTGESTGIITPPAKWSNYTQASVSFGHEIAVTPVQMVRAFSVFARNGTLPEIRLTAASPEETEFAIEHRILNAEIARVTRETMFHVAEHRSRRSELYTMFGKSGTAQLPNREAGGYHQDRYVSSFIAGAPLDQPRIIVLCIMDDPNRATGHFGGQICGPIARDIIDEVLPYLGVSPDKESPEANSTQIASAYAVRP